MNTVTGVVKKVVADRGFGFIAPEGDQGDIFFHVNEVVDKRMLLSGDNVRFEMGTNKGKPCAKRIQILGLSGFDKEWFAAVLTQDVIKLQELAASGQDVNAICRDKQQCQQCMGSGDGNVWISRRQSMCGACDGRGSARPMSTALFIAVQNGKFESVKALLALGADINHQSPIFEAVSGNEIQILEEMLNARADPNIKSDGCAPLFLAAKSGDTKIVEMLLEAGADPDVCGLYDNYDDYGDEVEYVSARQVARLKGRSQSVQAFEDWQQQKPLQVHVSPSEVPDSVELKVLNLAGELVVSMCASLHGAPSTIWEKIASATFPDVQHFHPSAETSQVPVGGKVRLILPDGRIFTQRQDGCLYEQFKSTAFTGSLQEFLSLTSPGQ